MCASKSQRDLGLAGLTCPARMSRCTAADLCEPGAHAARTVQGVGIKPEEKGVGLGATYDVIPAGHGISHVHRDGDDGCMRQDEFDFIEPLAPTPVLDEHRHAMASVACLVSMRYPLARRGG